MSAAHATLGPAPAVRAGGVLVDGSYRLHRDFMDFTVDGLPSCTGSATSTPSPR